jgi:putative hydrolase of the HAD superfamily
MRVDAVVFDLFGTLIDNFRVDHYQAVLDEMTTALGAPRREFSAAWIDSFGERVTGKPPTLDQGIRDICRRVGVTPNDGQVAAATRVRLEYSRRILDTRPHSLDTLAELRSRDLPLALVSDCTWEIPALWPDTPFAAYFAATVFSCELGTRKPDPRMYRSACELLAVGPRRCLYVGDGAGRELTGAQALGMHAIQLRAPEETPEHYGRNQAEEWNGVRLSHIAQVLDYLEQRD